MSAVGKWTPGPWIVRTRKDGSQYLSAGNPHTGPHEQWDLGGNRDTNALIGAAPDLYSALSLAVSMLGEFPFGEAALAKARGVE